MDHSDLTGGELILILLLGIAMMVAYPFIKALFIYAATRIMKFKKLSYWKSLYCVLIGAGTLIAIQIIFVGVALRPGHAFNPDAITESNAKAMILGFLLVPTVEAISMYLFFKESIGKTLGGMAVTYLFVIALLIVLFILFVALLLLMGWVST